MSYLSVVQSKPNLYGHWRCGEAAGSTSAADSSGNGRTATAVGSPTFGTTGLLVGDTDTAVTLSSGNNLSVTDDDGLDNISAMTLVAIVNPSSVASTPMLLARDGGSNRCWQFRLNAGKLEFVKIAGGTATASSAATLSAGTTCHVAVVYNGTDIRLYINGSLNGTPAAATGVLGGAAIQDLLIGARATGNPYSGVIDEVSVYTGALSATDIADLYTASRTLFRDDTTTTSETLTKRLNKALADTVTPSDSLSSDLQTGGSGLTHDEADTTTSTDTLTKALNKALDDTTTSSEALAKSVGHPVDDTTTSTDSLTATVGKTAADSTTSSDSLTTHLTKAIADTTTSSDVLDGTGTLSHQVEDTTTPTDTLGKHLTVHLADTTTTDDQLGAALHTHLGDTTPLTDDLTRALTKRIADQVTSSDQLTATRGLTLLLDDTTVSTDRLRSGPTAPTPDDRTRRITAEIRVRLITLEDRTRLIPAENRTKEAR